MRLHIYKKGVSELLALVLGLAITIAIGITFYAFLPSFLNTSLQQQKIALSISSINLLTYRNITMVISIKNLGSKDINQFNLTVEIPGASISNMKAVNIPSCYFNYENKILRCEYTIQAGQEISLLVRIDGTDFKLGQKIVVSVTARYVDNSIAVSSASNNIYQ